MGILDWLGIGEGAEAAGAQVDEHAAKTETMRKIVRSLEEMEPERARWIACFAYVLGRVAHADLDISDDETHSMERIVMERGGLSEEQAIIVVQLAKTQNVLFGGTENFLVTREFAEIASRDEKLALLDCLYAVSAADESISAEEDSEIRKIAGELRLDHKDFIAARSGYLDHLDVLKDGPGGG